MIYNQNLACQPKSLYAGRQGKANRPLLYPGPPSRAVRHDHRTHVQARAWRRPFLIRRHGTCGAPPHSPPPLRRTEQRAFTRMADLLVGLKIAVSARNFAVYDTFPHSVSTSSRYLFWVSAAWDNALEQSFSRIDIKSIRCICRSITGGFTNLFFCRVQRKGPNAQRSKHHTKRNARAPEAAKRARTGAPGGAGS